MNEIILRIVYGGSMCEENNIKFNNIQEFLINLKFEIKKRDFIINDVSNESLIDWSEKKKDVSVFCIIYYFLLTFKQKKKNVD